MSIRWDGKDIFKIAPPENEANDKVLYTSAVRRNAPIFRRLTQTNGTGWHSEIQQRKAKIFYGEAYYAHAITKPALLFNNCIR